MSDKLGQDMGTPNGDTQNRVSPLGVPGSKFSCAVVAEISRMKFCFMAITESFMKSICIQVMPVRSTVKLASQQATPYK